MPERQPISSRGEAPSGGRIVALVLTLASGLVFGGAVFSDEALYARDVMNYYWPTRHSAAESFRAGELPQWDLSYESGVPALGNIHAAVLYPPNVLYQWLSFPRAYGWLIWLHHLAAGLGAYVLLRRLRLEVQPAIAGALALVRGPDRSVAGGAIAHGRSAIGGLQRAGLADDDSAFSREAAGTRGAWGRFCLGGPRCRGPAVACIRAFGNVYPRATHQGLLHQLLIPSDPDLRAIFRVPVWQICRAAVFLAHFRGSRPGRASFRDERVPGRRRRNHRVPGTWSGSADRAGPNASRPRPTSRAWTASLA